MKYSIDYNVPPVYELREMYVVPYRFSDELQEFVVRMYEHPQHNQRNRELFTAMRKDTDPNDMLKGAYLIYKYYQEHPQRFGGQMNNVLIIVLARMWKTFLSLHKNLRGAVYDKYLPNSNKMLALGEQFLDRLEAEVLDKKFMSAEDLLPEPKSKKRKYTSAQRRQKALDYYDTL